MNSPVIGSRVTVEFHRTWRNEAGTEDAGYDRKVANLNAGNRVILTVRAGTRNEHGRCPTPVPTLAWGGSHLSHKRREHAEDCRGFCRRGNERRSLEGNKARD